MLFKQKLLLSAFLVFAALIACSTACLAKDQQELWMPTIFGNNMVLQSGKATKVWGWAAAGETITVTVGNYTAKGKTAKDGKWIVTLKNLKETSEPLTMTVKGKNSTIEFTNVLIGDVWLGSGQSNMEWPVVHSKLANKEIASANYPKIRIFRVPGILRGNEMDDISWEANGTVYNGKHRVNDPNSVYGQWVECSPKTIGNFSAVLYFFGREIHLKTGKPIGLLMSTVGGTRIELWTPKDVFYKDPRLADVAKAIDEGKAAYEAALAKRTDPTKPVEVDVNAPFHYSDFYNGMIHPLIPYGIKGAIWYQGEGNWDEGNSYFVKMDAMVSSWRKLWGRGDFPFYYVQLANWLSPNDDPQGGDGWAKVREAQRAALAIPNTGMACAIDVGDPDDIHPKNKQDVGKRLALWALRDNYGFTDIVPCGPCYKSMKIEGNKIRVSFDYIGSGLMVGVKDGLALTKEVTGEPLKRFAIAGEDKKWFWADAEIDGDTVVVSSPNVPNPVAVRYAYSMNPTGANLYNKEGLPAFPFRTDDW